MIITLNEIIAFLGKDLLAINGFYADAYIDNLADVDHVNEHTLDWVVSKKVNKQEFVEASKARCILVDETVDYNDMIKISIGG